MKLSYFHKPLKRKTLQDKVLDNKKCRVFDSIYNESNANNGDAIQLEPSENNVETALSLKNRACELLGTLNDSVNKNTFEIKNLQSDQSDEIISSNETISIQSSSTLESEHFILRKSLTLLKNAEFLDPCATPHAQYRILFSILIGCGWR
jgi:hypothetical protein